MSPPDSSSDYRRTNENTDAAMAPKIYIDTENSLIVVESAPTTGSRAINSALDAVVALADERDMSKVLIDAKSSQKLPPIADLFQFAEKLSRVPRKLKYAVVVSDETPQDTQFLELSASNRSVSIKIFKTKEEAISWLA